MLACARHLNQDLALKSRKRAAAKKANFYFFEFTLPISSPTLFICFLTRRIDWNTVASALDARCIPSRSRAERLCSRIVGANSSGRDGLAASFGWTRQVIKFGNVANSVK